MTDWVRLWHDMPTDPKWRVIARKSGQTISMVMAVWTFAMVNASANANERGRTHNLNAEDIAAALDEDEASVEAILSAMQGKVLDGDRLTGWEKRQPKREDGAAERAKEWRERKRTQTNAAERSDAESDTDTDNIPPTPPPGGFEQFWILYPEKTKKAAAEKEFAQALKSAPLETILDGVRRYAATKPTKEAWKSPDGWLRAKRWTDQRGAAPLTATSAKPPNASVCTYAEMLEKRGKTAMRQADDGGGMRAIASIAPTVLVPIEGVIS